MVRTIILAAGSRQLAELVKTIAVMDGCGLKSGLGPQKALAGTIGGLLDEITGAAAKLEKTLAKEKNGVAVVEALAELRKLVDVLEKQMDDDLWPLPKYREMLFIN